MNRVECNVENLPRKIILGRMTEKGVNEVHIDCTPWLEMWSTMTISLWVTPPRGAAYKVIPRRIDACVVWLINDTDTMHTGRGTVEIVGEASGVRKLSSIIETHIL